MGGDLLFCQVINIFFMISGFYYPYYLIMCVKLKVKEVLTGTLLCEWFPLF